MYDDLIKQLRYCADATTCRHCPWRSECCLHDAQRKAADAIEELQKITTHYEEESKGWWLAACDAKEERERLKEQIPKWIPVTERLPKEDETVMTWGKQGIVLLDWLHDNKWCCFGEATHWMPLPEAPKEET